MLIEYGLRDISLGTSHVDNLYLFISNINNSIEVPTFINQLFFIYLFIHKINVIYKLCFRKHIISHNFANSVKYDDF